MKYRRLGKTNFEISEVSLGTWQLGEAWGTGVDFDTALDAVERIRRIVPANVSMADFAMRWILQHDEVSCVIPGARNADQVVENAKTSDLPPLTPEQMQTLANIYQDQIKPLVHHRW